MTPKFSLTAWDKDITPIMADRGLKIDVFDTAGIDGDRLHLSFDDRDNLLHWPDKGAKLAISLGYEHSGVYPMGNYVVDEVEYSEPPAMFAIRAKAADFATSAFKSQKTRSWPKHTTFGAVVRKIAAEHKLKPRISPALAAIALPVLHQTEESDMHLLTRLGEEYDAVAKVAAGCLLFVERGQSCDASGKPLPVVKIEKSGQISVRVVEADRHKYKSVIAYWHNEDTNHRVAVLYGHGEPRFALRFNYANAAQARQAAKAKFNALARQARQLTIDMPGDPKAVGDSRLSLSGFRDRVNGEWVARLVHHTYSAQGFSTHIQAEPYLPPASAPAAPKPHHPHHKK